MNLMKLKAQTEILEDKTTYYKIIYQEIDEELLNEIKELCPMEIKLQKGRKIKKILDKK